MVNSFQKPQPNIGILNQVEFGIPETIQRKNQKEPYCLIYTDQNNRREVRWTHFA